MKNLDLATLGIEEMNEVQMQEVDGGLLPLAVICGIWAFQLACCAVALGMQEAMNEHK